MTKTKLKKFIFLTADAKGDEYFEICTAKNLVDALKIYTHQGYRAEDCRALLVENQSTHKCSLAAIKTVKEILTELELQHLREVAAEKSKNSMVGAV